MNRDPQIHIGVGLNYTPLEQVVARFPKKLIKSNFNVSTETKYFLFEKNDPYLLIVSQKDEEDLRDTLGYNVFLSTVSYSQKQNRENTRLFEETTGIDLSSINPPTELRQRSQILGPVFKIFQRKPEATIALFKEGKLF